jgi:hypothetical protein
MRINLNPLILLMVLAAIAWAGATSYNSLELNPTGGETNSLRINNSSGTAQFTITAAGAATFAGAVAMQGAQTVTADMTFSGAGIDILFNAADENEIGSNAAPAEKLWTNELDVEDQLSLDADLVIGTAGSDILVTDNTTDIGTEAASIKAAYVKTFDADTSINTDGTLTVTGTGATTLGGAAAVAGKVTVGGVFSLVASAAETVASATTIAPTKGLIYLTGNTAITGVTIGPYTAGCIVIFANVGGDATGPVVTDGNNLAMAGNLTLGPNDTITFVSDGTNLIEIARAVN